MVFSCGFVHLLRIEVMSHPKEGESSSSAGVSKEEFSELMAAMKGIQRNMESMKRELSSEREAADDRLLKKMRLTKGIEFKRKGNEKQHVFNEEVKDKIESATKALCSTPPAVDRAKEALKEGEKLLTARQKLIRIADRSEYGWSTVAEYEEDELADGSDDEKRLYKAELRAGRKVKATKQKFRKKDQPNRVWRPRWQSQPNSMFGGNGPQSSSSVASKPSGGEALKPRSSLGPCFECGKYGHFRKNCPDLVGK